MSAIRRPSRRSTREASSSPYSRSTTPQTSQSWTITGLLSYFIPFRSIAPNTNGVRGEDTELIPPQSSAAREQQLPQDLGQDQPPAAQTISSIPLPSVAAPAVPIAPPRANPLAPHRTHSPRPAENFKIMTEFFHQKGDEPLTKVEAAGLVALVHDSTEPDAEKKPKREPFRFPSRSSSPGEGNPSDVSNNSNQPRKFLTKNPNGPYRWEGAGSARPRNRYRSPAFGSPRPSTPRMELSPKETPMSDTKRRRMAEEAAQPATTVLASANRLAPPALPAEAPRTSAFPMSIGTNSVVNDPSIARKVNGAPLPPRLRTAGLPAKATAPAVPSPLRQTWGQSDSDSSPPQAKPTKAASYMTELIKEVTPPKKPDISNPYQTASPVKPPAKKPVRRSRAAAKPSVPAETKQPEMLPQAIIEATVPKGSKRSRPPHLEKPSSEPTTLFQVAPSRRSPPPDRPILNGVDGATRGWKVGTRPAPITIEDVEDEQDQEQSPPKKQKTTATNTKSDDCTVIIEELDDADILLATVPIRPAQIIETKDKSSFKHPPPAPLMSAFPSTSGAGPSQSGNRGLFGVKTSAPKEPSKLRFSYQPDVTPSPPTPQPRKGKEKEKARIDPKEAALRMQVDELPTYAFNIGTASPVTIARYVTAQSAATVTPVDSLPTFNFAKPLESISGARQGKTDVKPAAPTTAPVAFDWAAAGMKPPTKTGSWTCSLCMLENPDSAVDKCKTCDTPRPSAVKSEKKPTPATLPASAPAAVAFDWAAAGLKPPSKKDVWSCAVCMLDNPESAVEKCKFCDSPR